MLNATIRVLKFDNKINGYGQIKPFFVQNK